MRLSRLWEPVQRWGEFRRRQLAALEESNRIAAQRVVPTASASTPPSEDVLQAAGPAATPTASAVPTPDVAPAITTRFGELGQPLNRHSPFYLGFFGATGAVVAVTLWRAVGQIATTVTVLLVALFLTLALNPLVEWLTSRGLRRGGAVLVVSAGLIALVGIVAALIVPPVITEGSQLIDRAPRYLDELLRQPWVQDLDKHYGVIEKFQRDVTARITDQAFISGVLGGILGAGRVVASGLFQTVTVLVLTLYFLAALPKMKSAAYNLVPASRRARVISLTEETVRRVGSYAVGQGSIAALNGALSWVMMTVLDIPYAAVLAVLVAFLGLIPMVGATLGAMIVCLVAFLTAPKLALIAAIYYLLYQQIENYVIAPRVMQHTVSVPGAVTLVAALAGGALLGVLGALLAIPVAAALLLLFDEVVVPRQAHL